MGGSVRHATRRADNRGHGDRVSPPEIPGEKSGAGCSARNLFNNPSKFRHNAPA
jgi:hypothetical protein